ncbi:MAG: hypothetical protein APF80_01795 [Alphaproteobacteria bacterium BRH_c36]|nr:MAG: hypothetical protein APF80_01795 [Alphaproteobacteria bacterium BRH_c36]
MSDTGDKDSKTEEATPKKLHDALEEGNVAISKEVGIFVSMFGIYFISVFFLEFGIKKILLLLRQFLEQPDQWRLLSGEDAHYLFLFTAMQSLWIFVPVAAVLMSFALIASTSQAQPRIIAKRITPDLSRLSIIKGWNRIFGTKGLVEFLKTLAKFAILSIVGLVVIRVYKAKVVAMLQVSPASQIQLLHELANGMLVGVTLAFLLIVAADVIWTQFSWRRDLRMSKEEVKDEHKQLEGDPIVRSRVRSMIRDLARRRMISSVPRATMIIANPTHYAVALRYVKGETPAPAVLAKGKNRIALKIREIAEREGIPVIEDKALARSLYDAVQIDQLIPSEFYGAIASLVLTLSKQPPSATTKP